MKKPKAAGIVIYKMVNGEPFYLGLWTGRCFDLTKGHIDGGESPLKAARRETKEESNVVNIDLYQTAGVFRNGKLVMFIGESYDTPYITPNPKTGEYEHKFAKWMPFHEIIKLIDHKLLPVIMWANKKILDKHVY
jgi:8-oxo-dGTP pyrophosphatase MutT (NUDIX family)